MTLSTLYMPIGLNKTLFLLLESLDNCQSGTLFHRGEVKGCFQAVFFSNLRLGLADEQCRDAHTSIQHLFAPPLFNFIDTLRKAILNFF